MLKYVNGSSSEITCMIIAWSPCWCLHHSQTYILVDGNQILPYGRTSNLKHKINVFGFDKSDVNTVESLFDGFQK